MGKYNRYYEDYYKKKEEQNIDSKLDTNNDLEGQSQSRYIVRNDNNAYNRKMNNNSNQNTVSEIITIVTATTLIPTIFFAGVFMCKNVQGAPKSFYEHVKSAVTTSGFYKDKLELALKNSGVSIVNSDEKLNSTDKNSTNINKESDAELDNSLITNAEILENKVKVGEATTNNTGKIENKTNELINLDEKYKSFVETLNGAIVKAKSENGIVLACQYKIIVSPVSGIIDEVGKNAEGDFVSITHADGIETLYYNLPNVNLKEGQAIKKGEKIVDIQEEREIVFKIKENEDFIAPKAYAEFIK